MGRCSSQVHLESMRFDSQYRLQPKEKHLRMEKRGFELELSIIEFISQKRCKRLGTYCAEITESESLRDH